MRPRDLFRGLRGSMGVPFPLGGPGGQGASVLMIHEANMPVYMGSRFSLRRYGFTRGSTRGPRGPKKYTTARSTGSD